MAPNPRWTEHQFEQFLGNLLKTGVILAATVVSIGGFLYLLRYGSDPPHYRIFHGEPAELRTLSGIFTDAFSLRRRALIQFGLLILIATPILRVAFSAIAFAQMGDRPYSIITLIILTVLLYSLFNSL